MVPNQIKRPFWNAILNKLKDLSQVGQVTKVDKKFHKDE